MQISAVYHKLDLNTEIVDSECSRLLVTVTSNRTQQARVGTTNQSVDNFRSACITNSAPDVLLLELNQPISSCCCGRRRRRRRWCYLNKRLSVSGKPMIRLVQLNKASRLLRHSAIKITDTLTLWPSVDSLRVGGVNFKLQRKDSTTIVADHIIRCACVLVSQSEA